MRDTTPVKTRLFIGHIVNFISPQRVEEFSPGYLAIDEHGRIDSYGMWNSVSRRRLERSRFFANAPASHIVSSQYLIMPGFVDTHLHLPQFHLRGIYGVGLLRWLNDYILPAEARFADGDFARRTAERFFAELLKNGTTTALVYSSVHKKATDIAFAVAAQAGIRAIIGKVMMDRNVPAQLKEKTSDSVRDSLELYGKWHGYDENRLQYAFAPRFAPACSEALLREVGIAARRTEAIITSHLAENRDEVKLARKLFPHCRSYTDIYYRTGVLGAHTVMAHCIHLSAHEYQQLAHTKTKVAHCPTANMFLHSGSMDLRRMEKARITIGLGTDVGAGPWFSLLRVMQSTYFLHKMSPRKAFYRATLGGAKVLGLGNTTGSFASGKDADFIVIRLPELQPHEMRLDALLAQLMFRADDRHIFQSWVKGRCVFRR